MTDRRLTAVCGSVSEASQDKSRGEASSSRTGAPMRRLAYSVLLDAGIELGAGQAEETGGLRLVPLRLAQGLLEEVLLHGGEIQPVVRKGHDGARGPVPYGVRIGAIQRRGEMLARDQP